MAKRKKVRSSRRPESRAKQAFSQSEQRAKQFNISSPVSWGWSHLDASYPSKGGPKTNSKYWHGLIEFLATLETHPRTRGRIGAELSNAVCGFQLIANMPERTQNCWRKLVEDQEEWATVTHLYRFRFGGEYRAYSLPPNDAGVSYILWIDPSHEVWPSDR